jgi:hypothetical protein
MSNPLAAFLTATIGYYTVRYVWKQARKATANGAGWNDPLDVWPDEYDYEGDPIMEYAKQYTDLSLHAAECGTDVCYEEALTALEQLRGCLVIDEDMLWHIMQEHAQKYDAHLDDCTICQQIEKGAEAE